MVWIASFAALIFLLFVAFLLNFYRDPKREIPRGSNIVSPADGRIIRIVRTNSNEVRISKGLFGKIRTLTSDIAKDCYVISIFMSPLDVHVNRAPIDGHVISKKYSRGRFFMAFDLERSLNNEKNEIVIENGKIGKIKVIQIAGFLARRIICNVGKNEKVNKGQKIGRIVLGSQVTIVLPAKSVRLRAKEKLKVKAGTTILAEVK